ncbi:hypothetical protein [Mechercharimyces sp. CAU 1602]|uniref:hypothetical protein n=1 Tax=Mechercharimyces sp. CAU 1602 TaxID=2973933 RepID=UPI00216229AC|nr:hypothetical protein [Mechercharimyces sp. CAU 1602]MCS1352442.1 hypothetical protein [Mechercharimyces sp. CAU 1602]
MNSIKNAADIYISNVSVILKIIIIYSLPILLINYYISNYFYIYFDLLGLGFIGAFVVSWIQIVVFALLQLPYIQVVIDEEGGMLKVSRILDQVSSKMFAVYLIGLVQVILVAIGNIFLVIPGIIILLLTLLFPYAICIDDRKGLGSLKRSAKVSSSHLFKLIGLLLIMGLLQGIIQLLILYGGMVLTNSLLFLALMQIGTSALCIPLFTFILALNYMNWTNYADKEVWD